MNDGIDKLLKSDSDAGQKRSFLQSAGLSYNKGKINSLCRALGMSSDKYDPALSVTSIEEYVISYEKLSRLLYSEVSNYIFSLGIKDRGTFATNLDKLLLYTLNESNGVSESCRDIVVRIYDHSQLALYQIENVKNIFASSVDEVRDSIQADVKKMEREYISILGIFAAIVLAFVGGITFSSSVLQSIGAVSIYRLLLITDMLAFVMLNMIYILVTFIFRINGMDTGAFKISRLNWTCIIIAAVTATGWLLQAGELKEYLARFLVWCG